MASTDEQKKKERKDEGDVRAGGNDVPRVYAINGGSRLFGAWAQRFVVTVLSLPFRTLPVQCAARRMPLTIMHSLLRRQIIRS